MKTVNLSMSQILSLMGHNGGRVNEILQRASLLNSERPLNVNDLHNLEAAIDEARDGLPKIGEVDAFGEEYTADQYTADCAALRNLWIDACRIGRAMDIVLVVESEIFG